MQWHGFKFFLLFKLTRIWSIFKFSLHTESNFKSGASLANSINYLSLIELTPKVQVWRNEMWFIDFCSWSSVRVPQCKFLVIAYLKDKCVSCFCFSLKNDWTHPVTVVIDWCHSISICTIFVLLYGWSKSWTQKWFSSHSLLLDSHCQEGWLLIWKSIIFPHLPTWLKRS